MPSSGLKHAARYYLLRFWSGIVEMSGVAPVGSQSGPEGSFIRPPDQFDEAPYDDSHRALHHGKYAFCSSPYSPFASSSSYSPSSCSIPTRVPFAESLFPAPDRRAQSSLSVSSLALSVPLRTFCSLLHRAFLSHLHSAHISHAVQSRSVSPSKWSSQTSKCFGAPFLA